MKIIIEGEVFGFVSLSKNKGSGLKDWQISNFAFKPDERYKITIIESDNSALSGEVYFGNGVLFGTGILSISNDNKQL